MRSIGKRLPRTSGLSLAALAVAALLAGCGDARKSGSAPMASRHADAAVVGMAPEAAEPVNAVNAEQNDKDAPPPAEKVRRKIKYTADLKLITEDFPKAEDALVGLIDASGGFLAFADVSTVPGQPRFGIWRTRVPVEKFEDFRKGVSKIGELESSKVNTEDVTAQFYDLENHIKNKKAQEDALRELLKKQTDKMENLLAVQRELSSVRDSIERSEGQLRVLANLTDLTTVTIRIQERKKFVPEKPPEPAEKPTFGARAGKSFGESWRSLVDVAQDLAIALVALTPWLPILLLAATPVYRLIRRRRARAKSAVTQSGGSPEKNVQ